MQAFPKRALVSMTLGFSLSVGWCLSFADAELDRLIETGSPDQVYTAVDDYVRDWAGRPGTLAEVEQLLETLVANSQRASAERLTSIVLARMDSLDNEQDRASFVNFANALQTLNLTTQAREVATRGIKITGKMTADALNQQSYALVGDLELESGAWQEAMVAYQSAQDAADSTSASLQMLLKRAKLASVMQDQASLDAIFAEFKGLESEGIENSALLDSQLAMAAYFLNLPGAEALESASALLAQLKSDLEADDQLRKAELAELTSQYRRRSGDFDRAIQEARLALLDAGTEAGSGQSYRLYWRLAQALAASGDVEAAEKAYAQSINKLTNIRAELLQGSSLVFQERVLPVYQDYIALLLSDAAKGGAARREARLGQVQELLESFNASEVLDYFDDNCLLPENTMSLSEVAVGDAVLYPIILNDDAYVLVRLNQAISLVKLDAQVAELKRQTLQFRESIVNASTSESQYMAQSKALYQSLFAEMGPILRQNEVKRIISVPSGFLRLVPLGALHSGSDYLVKEFELVTSLGLSLTDQGALDSINESALIGGVSDAVQGFEALPGVESELAMLSGALGAKPLLNEAFTADAITRRLATGRQGIVHLATHGVFDRDHASSFILAHDEKITLDRLQNTVGARQYTGEPLDLLVLSACETAKGDERAALGLAGVSLKAGARSTVASLWPIADEATALLMQQFYQALRQGETKSRALQLAQIALINEGEWSHPSYWSPYLLIGNWL